MGDRETRPDDEETIDDILEELDVPREPFISRLMIERDEQRQRLEEEVKEQSAFRTPDVDEWHICRDCIVPLAHYLEVQWRCWCEGADVFTEGDLHGAMMTVDIWWRWGAVHTGEAAFGIPDIGFGLVWLEVNVSPEVARNFESRLRALMDEIAQHALQWADESDRQHKLGNLVDESSRLEAEYSLERRRHLDLSLWGVIAYLRRLAVVLDARLEDRAPKKGAVAKAARPQKEWCYDEPPPPGSQYEHGPIEGTLEQIGRWSEAGIPKTVKARNGTSFWYVNMVKGRHFEMWFNSAKRFENTKEARDAEMGNGLAADESDRNVPKRTEQE